MNDSKETSLTRSQIDDMRLAASKMNLVDRRSFQAAITVKYCKGKARLAESRFGWGRDSVELGLADVGQVWFALVLNLGTRGQNGGKTNIRQQQQSYN